MFEGILLLDKPDGPTTAACTRKFAKLTGSTKSGHAGTLDPMATGLVITLFGRATKLSPYLSSKDKTYTGCIRLGVTTATGDRKGKILSEKPVTIDKEQLFEISRRITGEQSQVPPHFSAVKHQGKPLYKYARKGISIDVEPREINVESFAITSVELPDICFECRVSKGTYIRVLAERFGEMAGCGAHLAELRRTAIGSFSVDDAITLEKAVELAQKGELAEKLINLKDSLADMKEIAVERLQAIDIAHGKYIDFENPGLDSREFFIMTFRERLLAVAEWNDESAKLYSYRCVLVRPEELEN